MYKGSFIIEGWDTDEPAPPLSHRLQLQPLQEIITKAKGNSPNTSSKLQPFPTARPHKPADTFHSTTISRKKMKTQPQRIQLKTLSQPTKLITQQPFDSQSKQQLFKRTEGTASFFKSIITFIQKEPTALKKSPRFMLENKKQQENYCHKNKRHSKSMNILPKKEPIRPEKRLDTISKYRINFRNEDVVNSRCIPFSKEESLKRLKKFFLQTLQGIENRKNDKLQKNHETKLKNMLEKSNRKKKEIQQLFKTRVIVGQNVQQRRFKCKIQKLLVEPQERIRAKTKKLFSSEFDDQGLFCPWSYRQQKMMDYMRAKHQ